MMLTILCHQIRSRSQLAILQNQPEGYVCSCSWGKFVDDPKEAWFEKQEVFGDFPPVDWLVTSWEGGGMMQTACWLVPRNIAESAGSWNEKLSLHDDGEYFARILLASRGIKFCDNAKVYYRTNMDSSLSRQQNRKAAESAFDVCESYRKNILRKRIHHEFTMH